MPNDFLRETFAIHNRITLFLLEAIEEAHLCFKLNGKGRSAGEQFMHLHNVRLMWLKSAAPELLEGQTKWEKETPVTKALILERLQESGKAIEQLFELSAETGKIKGFKPNSTAFLAYLISHESHHRGQIALILKHNHFPLNPKTSFGLWEWGVR